MSFMVNSYCGKICDNCAFAEQLNCPGCKTQQYSPIAAQCAIAACCRNRGHETCETCNFRENCPNLNKRDANPEQIIQKQAELQRRAQAEAEARAREQAQLRKIAAILGKWVWVLFWLAMAGIVVGLLGNIESLSGILSVIKLGLAVAMGLIYLKKLSEAHDGFRLAALGGFTAAATSLLSIVGVGKTLNTVLTLALLIPSMVGMYYEFTTYSDLLQGVDNDLSEKWRKLWKIYIICAGVTFGSLLLLFIPTLAVLAMLGSVVGLLVASVLEWIYLYKTAKVFREITDK